MMDVMLIMMDIILTMVDIILIMMALTAQAQANPGGQRGW